MCRATVKVKYPATSPESSTRTSSAMQLHRLWFSAFCTRMSWSSKAQVLPKGYRVRITQPAGQAPHQPGSSLLVPERGEQGSPGMAARFHQESTSSGKIMVMRRSGAKLGVQVRIRSGYGYHREVGPRNHREGSQWQVSPQVGEQIKEVYSWALGCPVTELETDTTPT